MGRKILLYALGLFLGLGLFFWWRSQQIAPMSTFEASPFFPWRTIEHQGKDIVLKSLDTTNRDEVIKSRDTFLNFVGNKMIIYGKGTLPEMSTESDKVHLTFTDGIWIVRSLDSSKKISIQHDTIHAEIIGEGGVFLDIEKDILINFDAVVTMKDTKNLDPSFYVNAGGEKNFFDFGSKDVLIPKDLEDLYFFLYPRQMYSVFFPNVSLQEASTQDFSKNKLDEMLKTLISREPATPEGKFFSHDMRSRNILIEIETIIGKMNSRDVCGDSPDACHVLLREFLEEGKGIFPDIFIPLEEVIQAWIMINTGKITGSTSWLQIFRTYHMQRIQHDFLATINRDKAILDMIKFGRSRESIEVWGFLTKMLASQNFGSIYSMQIVREMLRIGDELLKSKDISDAEKSMLAANTLEGLQNIKSVLENTYFTKKNYWFVLRTDLVDSEGNSLNKKVFVDDLDLLINQIDSSLLLVSAPEELRKKLPLIRSQLIWFRCIFDKNDAYVKNPRICRITSA